jgi:hypothetical protein
MQAFKSNCARGMQWRESCCQAFPTTQAFSPNWYNCTPICSLKLPDKLQSNSCMTLYLEATQRKGKKGRQPSLIRLNVFWFWLSVPCGCATGGEWIRGHALVHSVRAHKPCLRGRHLYARRQGRHTHKPLCSGRPRWVPCFCRLHCASAQRKPQVAHVTYTILLANSNCKSSSPPYFPTAEVVISVGMAVPKSLHARNA